MQLLFNSLLLLAGLGVTVFGLVTLRHDAFNGMYVALGLGMVVVTFYLDRLRVRHRDERVAQAISERTATLTRRPWQAHERLEVPPNRWLFGLMLGMALVGGWMVLLGFGTPNIKWPLVLGGVLFLAIETLMLPSMLTGLGKPALMLDRKGLTTPVDGAIPWSAVEGIYLQVIEHRGVKNYALIFRVPTYVKTVSSIHWSQRWLALFGLGALRRAQVGVPLRPGKERPETIEAVARHLWKSATGREHFWSPNASDAMNDSMRQLSALHAELTTPAVLDRELKDHPEKALAWMKEDMARLNQVNHHMDVIKSEQKKAHRTLNIVIAVAVFGMLLSLAWPWLRRWLGG